MGWFIFVICMAVLFGIAFFVQRVNQRQYEASLTALTASGRTRPNEEAQTIARIAGIGKWVALGVLVIGSLLSCVDQVANGHVGLIYQFGAIQGQRGDGHGGVIFHLPWQGVQQANVQVQKILPQTDCPDGTHNCLSAASSESQDVFITPSINIHVNVADIQKLYRTVGPDYVNVLIEPRVAQVTKEETAKYKSTDIIPNRETLRATITKRLTEELAQDSITVDDFLLTDVHFSQAFNQAIEAKVTTEQQAQAEQNKVAVTKAQADQAVAQAQGQADAQVALAKGQAQANNLINASLTPELIQYTTVQKLAPDVKVIMLPAGGNGLILDMGGLTGTASAQPTK